ncbi:hypothetical protein D0X99_17940 [Algoriphagus lacus]|uniref:Uncharacterized protein n=1 Tax=Algoriphagus lacus TaxID=2056311 RepID=A0A418PNE6_9BACT|nr:hypothetical protein D0X99_17940 [Algoriphagus lacus]
MRTANFSKLTYCHELFSDPSLPIFSKFLFKLNLKNLIRVLNAFLFRVSFIRIETYGLFVN